LPEARFRNRFRREMRGAAMPKDGHLGWPRGVPDAVQRPLRCAAEPGPMGKSASSVDPGSAAHHAARAARCAASGARKRASAFSRRDASEVCISCPSKNRGRRESRVPFAPAASCAKVESTRVSHHRFTGITRPSLRNGFNGLFRALPGDRAFLPPSPPRSLQEACFSRT
jgi:hypothetical protein